MSLFVAEDEPSEFSNDPTSNARTSQTPKENESEIPLHIEPSAIEVPKYLLSQVSQTTSLRFQQQIVRDMVEDAHSALLIMGRGLGWDILVANIIHAVCGAVELSVGTRKQPLIFVLNCSPDEQITLSEELMELNWLDGHSNYSGLTSISGETHNTVDKRLQTYRQGGVITIDSRFLVTDILSGALDVSNVTGIFVLHADKVSETSRTSFALNLFRDKNEWGFIKAFSDEPEQFTGFTPLASRLKNLRIRKAFLWPRFHIEISSSLTKYGKALTNRQKSEIERRRVVTEINVRLTAKQQRIQSALLACIKACLMELKRHVPELATEYWDMENIHDKDFIRRIRAVLDNHWHRISFTAKQLVQDISTLLDLLIKLVVLDSVSFYQIVQNIIDTNVKRSATNSVSSMAPWLDLDDANTVISAAKERALGKVTVPNTRSEDNEFKTVTQERYILEEQPKWDQLAILIDDIIHETLASTSSRSSGPIVIACSSNKVASQLEDLLKFAEVTTDPRTGRKRFSFRHYMERKLRDYQEWKRVNQMVRSLAYSMIDADNPDSNQVSTTKTFSKSNEVVSKRRRTRGDSATARVQRLYADTDVDKFKGGEDLEPELLAEVMCHIEEVEKTIGNESDNFSGDETVYNERALFLNELVPTLINQETQVIIQPFDERLTDSTLDQLGPSYIIMFEPNLAFIRRTEMYQALNRENPAKVFLLYYGGSVEEERHLLAIKKEKEAFTRLIREKGNLAKSFEAPEDNWKFNVHKADIVNTRIAGGSTFRTSTEEFKVIVDAREFRSDLPNLLYRIGITVVPMTLLVGDYVLSPKICIERKSVPDLIGSFKSGRLAQQCEQMFRSYELPCLLIEFDEGKSFSLEPFSELSTARGRQSDNALYDQSISVNIKSRIQAKILSLLIAYPKLKIIWSSSPFETAQIFWKLKLNQQEPSPEEALKKGAVFKVNTGDDGPPQFNDGPIDLLLNIPGINSVNIHVIIAEVKNIQDLVKLSKERITELLGQVNGGKAYRFIHEFMK
ncbi:DNA repair protein Rad1p [Diutina rugosa]